MEILSDATFKGNVSINGGNFSVTGEGGPSFSSFIVGSITTDNGATGSGSEFQSTTIGGVFINGDFSVTKAGESKPLIETDVIDENNSYRTYALRVNGSEFINGDLLLGEGLYVNHGGISLNSCIISSWYDLNNLLSFAKLKTFTSPSIPANCTAFEFTGAAISDSNKTHLIQVQNTSTGKSVIAETWMTSNWKPAMSFAGCTSTIAAGTYKAMVV